MHPDEGFCSAIVTAEPKRYRAANLITQKRSLLLYSRDCN
jgi:hypothetical protein